MDLKSIQHKLKNLRDRIREQGRISHADEQELQSLIRESLSTANSELEGIQARLELMSGRKVLKSNDNVALTQDQKKRLADLEKTGTGSNSVH